MKKITFLAFSLVFSLSFANTNTPAQSSAKPTSISTKKVTPPGPLNRYIIKTEDGRSFTVFAYSYKEAEAIVIKQLISEDLGLDAGQGPIYG